jgi:hypothetical protein
MMREADWTWQNSFRFKEKCYMVPGTSGAPMVVQGTRNIVGINNTQNYGAEKCTMNNPCEVLPNGETISYPPQPAYAQNLQIIYSCLDNLGHLDLELQGCQLPH